MAHLDHFHGWESKTFDSENSAEKVKLLQWNYDIIEILLKVAVKSITLTF
jgi:hypothetical protein